MLCCQKKLFVCRPSNLSYYVKWSMCNYFYAPYETEWSSRTIFIRRIPGKAMTYPECQSSREQSSSWSRSPVAACCLRWKNLGNGLNRRELIMCGRYSIQLEQSTIVPPFCLRRHWRYWYPNIIKYCLPCRLDNGHNSFWPTCVKSVMRKMKRAICWQLYN